VCGSDVHTINGGWGEQKFPLAVGHGMLCPESWRTPARVM
jgi:alcohol dehydrogenase (NADP+)